MKWSFWCWSQCWVSVLSAHTSGLGEQPSASPICMQDAAHLEAGQPVQYEADVVVYLQECEGLLRQLQVDVQILRDENYYQLEELAFR